MTDTVGGRPTVTPTGVSEFMGFTKISGGLEYPSRFAVPVPGTATASVPLIPDANKDITGLRDVTVRNLAFTGGVTPITAPSGIANWQPVTATGGTDTTPANGTQFVASIYIPVNFTVTNINYLIGSVGGTDKVYGVLYDSTGAVLANTSLTSGGATVGTAANIQTIALTATYAAKGPGLFYVGISMNGNTARLRTVPAFTQAGLWAGSVSQTHGTVAAIAAPTTFTADKAPVLFLS